jgi:hypothetical protein
MKERGMLFSKPMVLALLDGSKTQTRRVVKPQPTEEDGQIYGGTIFGPEMYEPATIDKHGDMIPGPEIFGIYTEDGDWGVKCPYGKPGDRIWVRENFQPIYAEGWNEGKNDETGDPVNYKTGEGYDVSYPATDGIVEFYDSETDECSQRVWPSIHMPRWASRIDLEITGVSVERLQDISEADSAAEGIRPNWIGDLTGWNPVEHGYLPHDTNDEGEVPGVDIYDDLWTAKRCYQRLWESINGPGSWDENPWVWVVEFRRVKP